MEQTTVTAIASCGALFISIASFIFAVLSWREAHRPIVTVRITTQHGGNVASPVKLIVENSGNRPAINVQLDICPYELDRALAVSKSDPIRASVERCFDRETFIPVLEGGKLVSNSFGVFKDPDPTWVYKSTLSIGIKYRGLNGRRFRERVPVWLVDNRSFALGFFDHGSP